jgi:hypothetical protein
MRALILGKAFSIYSASLRLFFAPARLAGGKTLPAD